MPTVTLFDTKSGSYNTTPEEVLQRFADPCFTNFRIEHAIKYNDICYSNNNLPKSGVEELLCNPIELDITPTDVINLAHKDAKDPSISCLRYLLKERNKDIAVAKTSKGLLVVKLGHNGMTYDIIQKLDLNKVQTSL